MEAFDVIVVGSGPGATFAAYGARGKKILVLDAGNDATPAPKLPGTVYDLRREMEDLFPVLIGDRFETLRNLRRPVSPMLRSPSKAYVVEGWERLAPVAGDSFRGAISLAKGGLANAWGAGVYRFRNSDLQGFPLDAGDLRPFYDELTRHIGVCGFNDDLSLYFGREGGLLPPMRLSGFFEEMLRRYERLRSIFQAQKVVMGRPRLAVLTKPHDGRPAYGYSNLESFTARDPAIYSPAYTMDAMIRAGAVEYRAGRLVTRFTETSEGVEVRSRRMDTGEEEVHQGSALMLGAGALNTARIVLASNEDYETRLPALDNAMVHIPFFQWRRVGAPLEEHGTSLAQLNMIVEDDRLGELQASLHDATGQLRSDNVTNLPFSLRANLQWTKQLAMAHGVLRVSYPGQPSPSSYVQLRPSGELEARFPEASAQPVEERLVRLLRTIGYVTHSSLIQRVGNGGGMHYAGTLPMAATPTRYETGVDGVLSGTNRVYVVDGAAFPRLPAKNLTFTIMANALRIGRRVASL